jgi:hypothetical protein
MATKKEIMKKDKYGQDVWVRDWKENKNDDPWYIDWEHFMAVVEAADQGQPPEWLVLKGTAVGRRAAKLWCQAREDIKERMEREKQEARTATLRAHALSKLSDEEKRILGIKD